MKPAREPASSVDIDKTQKYKISLIGTHYVLMHPCAITYWYCIQYINTAALLVLLIRVSTLIIALIQIQPLVDEL